MMMSACLAANVGPGLNAFRRTALSPHGEDTWAGDGAPYWRFRSSTGSTFHKRAEAGAGWGHSPRGAFWGFVTGILGGLGNMAFFGALSSGGNASVVAPSASLAPLITLSLAVVILRERPTATQWVGLLLSIVALYLLSI